AHRPRAPHDNAWPSGVSTTAFTLARLHALTGDERYERGVDRILRRYGEAATKNPFGFAHLLAASDLVRHGAQEGLFAGEPTAAAPLVEAVHRGYHPRAVLARAEHVPIGEGRTAGVAPAVAFLCEGRTCQAPTADPAALARALTPRSQEGDRADG